MAGAGRSEDTANGAAGLCGHHGQPGSARNGVDVLAAGVCGRHHRASQQAALVLQGVRAPLRRCAQEEQDAHRARSARVPARDGEKLRRAEDTHRSTH